MAANSSNCEDNLMIINEDFNGLHLLSGPPNVDLIDTLSPKIRAHTVSRDGNYIGFSDIVKTKLVDLNSRTVIFEQDLPGVLFMGLSPQNNFLQAWIHTKTPGEDNLMIYDLKSKERIKVNFYSNFVLFSSQSDFNCSIIHLLFSSSLL